MEKSNSRKRSFSSSGLPATGSTTTATNHNKKTKKKHSVKQSDGVEAPAAAAADTAISKNSKRHRRREKGKPKDGRNIGLANGLATAGASNQLKLTQTQANPPEDASEPVKQKTAAVLKSSSAKLQSNGRNAKTAASKQQSSGQSADAVAEQLRKDRRKAAKARKLRRARERAAREGAAVLAEPDRANPQPAKKVKKHVEKNRAQSSDKQTQSTSTARAILKATTDAQTTPNSTKSRVRADPHDKMLKPFEMDWDVIELKAAEKIAAGDVDWNKLTADQRTQLTRHYIGHPSNVENTGSASSSAEDDSETTSDDTDDENESSSSDDSDHPDDNSESSAAFAPPASKPTAAISQAKIASAPRVGQSGAFKPLGDRRLTVVPSRLGTVSTLADTQAKFQRLSKALNERRGGGSSDDSDSDSGSESESDDDGTTSKPIINGSVSETFSEPASDSKNEPADSEPGSLRPAEASNAAIKPELDSDSATDQDIPDDEEEEAAVRNGTVLDAGGNIDVGIASGPRSEEQAPSTVSSSSEDEDSESQSRASSPELAPQTGPSPTAGELDQEQNGSSSDSDEDSVSASADEGRDQLPEQSARQTTAAELAPQDNNAAESEDESESEASVAESHDVNGDDSEHDASEVERQEKTAALAAPVLNTSQFNEPAHQDISIQRGEDEDGFPDERLNDKSGSVPDHESESDEEEIVLNSDGELVLASSLASRQLTPKDNASGTGALEPAEVSNGTDEDDVGEDMHDADDPKRIAPQELDEESSDNISAPESRPDSTRKHAGDEQLEDRDDETDASGPGIEEDTTASIADPSVEASQQHLTTSQQQAAGTGSAAPEPSTTANFDTKIEQPSQDRGGVPSGLSRAPHTLANPRIAEAETFQDFATVAPSRPDFDLEEQEEISGTIQSVLADTRPLPEGEDPDEITASQAGSDHELIKDDGSISQDSTVLSSASANAGHSDKVRMGTPPNHATQGPPPALDLSDSDTDSSEDESDDSVVAGDDGNCTVAEPKCANDAFDAGKPTLSSLPGDQDQKYGGLPPEVQAAIAAALGTPQTSSVKKRKMTGNTSLHFATPSKTRSTSKKQPPSPASAHSKQQESSQAQASDTPAMRFSQQIDADPGTALTGTPSARTKRSPAKKTGTISEHFIGDRVDLYNTTAGKRRRVAAGESANPFPAIDKPYFGIIQERTWHEPFYLIVATVFLNKTTGRQAAPTFWKIRKRWPTPAELANADYDELFEMIKHLGLQHQRTKRLKSLAAAWDAHPPQAGKRHRTLHYPTKGDGKDIKKDTIIEDDADDCAGALEIAHLPGCGAYAYDSWRIFCRDVLRGVATDYQGAHAKSADFEPEWKRVLPGDKELRACLRWMWLKESIIWDPLTGEKREATEEEMEKARRGELELEDEAEAKFAAQAAGIDMTTPESAARGDDALDESPVKKGSVQIEREVAPAVDQEADWALQNSQSQANDAIKHDAPFAPANVTAKLETSAPPTTRITRAANRSHLEQVDPEKADTTPAKRRGRPRRAVIGSIQKAEQPQDPQSSTVTRSTRAKRQRSPSVEVDNTQRSPVAKRKKTATAAKNDVVKEEAPKRQSARLIDNDGLV